uniref:Maturation n=1 Tax=Leviviridae sp. TaxID=2027243 RepID=A0A514D3D7_9VIRU|nr:MAG: hypothetical protein H3Bulk40456_000001 [Leviviridae sp.]
MVYTYPRTVSSHQRVPYDWSYEYVNGGTFPAACNAPVRGVSSGSISYDDVVILGKSPDNWKQLIALGMNASSVLSGTRHTRGRGDAGGVYSYDFDRPGQTGASKCVHGSASGNLAFPCTGWPAALSSSPSSAADALAREKLLGKYLNIRKTWRGGNFLAEFAETVHQVRHPIESLFGSTLRFAKRVKGIRHLRGKHYAGALGNLWIGWSFGWKPLFDDISDFNKAITKLSEGTDHDTLPITANGKDDNLLLASTVGISASPNPINSYCKFDRFYSTSKRVKYYGALLARPESFSTVADTFGISPGDIVPAIWEAIPWSFFIDYFANVQQVLDSYQYAAGGLAWLNRGVRNSSSQTSSGWYTDIAAIPSNQRPSVVAGVGGSEKTTTVVQRSIVGQLPYPPFRFKIPNVFGAKGLNIAGLTAQIAASRP